MREELQPLEKPIRLLTIAIPTFNRANYLRGLLDSLFDQLVAETRVELIVSDNASPDETQSVVEGFMERGLAIRYIRNETNIGPDSNFQQCFEQAKGTYVWVFGDDDIIPSGGIAKILSYLSSDDYGVVYVSPYEFIHDHVAERIKDRFNRSDEILGSGLDMVRRAGAMLTFISAIIVNKDRYLRTVHQPLSSYVGTNLIQLGWVCPLLASESKHLYIWEKIVAGRGGNCAGWGPCQIFGINLKKIADESFHERPKLASELTNMVLQRWFPSTIMDSRRGTKNALLQENIKELLAPVYKDNWRYWIYVYPLISLPLVLARCWNFMLKYLNRLSRLDEICVEFFSFLLKKSGFSARVDHKPALDGNGRI